MSNLLCAVLEHKWVFRGARGCPAGASDCSQSVYQCDYCGEWDYGEPGGPGYHECCELKTSRNISLKCSDCGVEAKDVYLGPGWALVCPKCGKRVKAATSSELLRAWKAANVPVWPNGKASGC